MKLAWLLGEIDGLPLLLARVVARGLHFIVQRKQLLGVASRAEMTPVAQ